MLKSKLAYNSLLLSVILISTVDKSIAISILLQVNIKCCWYKIYINKLLKKFFLLLSKYFIFDWLKM